MYKCKECTRGIICQFKNLLLFVSKHLFVRFDFIYSEKATIFFVWVLFPRMYNSEISTKKKPQQQKIMKNRNRAGFMFVCR